MNTSQMLVVATSLMLLPALSSAAEWACKPDVEVQCSTESCSATEDQGVIPIELSFDSLGAFSLCAYSGCWEGKGKVVSAPPFLIITLGNVEGREDVLIAFSTKDHIAMVKAGSLSMPMRCSRE